MSNGRYTSKLLGLLASVLTPAAALSAVLVSPVASAAPPAAKPEVKRADCQIHAVLASKDEGGIEKDLEFLADKLKDDEFAAYKSFYKVEQKQLALKLGEASTAEFKLGHKLSLTLLGGDTGRLQLKLEMTGRDGKKSLLSTKYGIDSGGVLIVRAGKEEFTHKSHKGKVLYVQQCVSAGG